MLKPDNFCVCPTEHAGALNNRFRQWLQNPEKILEPFVKPGMHALDMGCGPGFFTLEMAKRVQDSGHLTACDLQPGMLEYTRQKLTGTGLEKRITFHQCQADRIGLSGPFDFILLFYMVHEVPDKPAFFREIATLLKPDGRALMVEPPLHVSKKAFLSFIDLAKECGLQESTGPKIFLSKSVIFKKQK